MKVANFSLDDNIPGKEDISKVVMWLRLNFTVVPSGMRAEHLRLWLRAAKREEHPNPEKWEKVFVIIHADFRGEVLAVLCTWKTVVMIPKGGLRNFREIGLVWVLWKAISGIIN